MDLNPEMKNTQAKINKFDFNFGSIDYFMTTNIFCPGAKVFKALPVNERLYVPRYVLLCGDTTTVKKH